jgi:hypothetical protein
VFPINGPFFYELLAAFEGFHRLFGGLKEALSA